MDLKAIFRSIRFRLMLSILVIVPLGFYSKFYTGPFQFWVNNSLGGVFYEIFWCLVFAAIFKNVRAWKIAGIVLLVTCTLEVLQLSDAFVLAWIRQFFIGRVLIGTHFVWSDFIYYVVGCLVGALLIKILKQK